MPWRLKAHGRAAGTRWRRPGSIMPACSAVSPTWEMKHTFRLPVSCMRAGATSTSSSMRVPGRMPATWRPRSCEERSTGWLPLKCRTVSSSKPGALTRRQLLRRPPRQHRFLRIRDANLDGRFEIQVRDGRRGGGLEETQGILGLVELFQADARAGHQGHQRLALVGPGAGELLVFVQGATIGLLVFGDAAHFKPQGGRQLLAFGPDKIFKALPGQIGLTGLQVNLAKPLCGFAADLRV